MKIDGKLVKLQFGIKCVEIWCIIFIVTLTC